MTESAITGQNQGSRFHLDYLTVTLFTDEWRAREFVGENLCERVDSEWSSWESIGRGSRWASILLGAGGVALRVPVKGDYVSVEIKGEACSLFGDDVLGAFLGACEAAQRSREFGWQATRIDPCWDGHGISPLLVCQWVAGREFRSRCKVPEKAELWSSEAGETCYFPTMKGAAERKLRVYNRRGYNRLEGEFRGRFAHELGWELSELAVAEWPKQCLRYLRSLVDFVEPEGAHSSRRPLKPEWAEFVDGASVRRLPGLPGPDDPSPLGRPLRALQRAGRSLAVLAEAFGEERVLELVRGLMRYRGLSDADRAEVVRLRPFEHLLDRDPSVRLLLAGLGRSAVVDDDELPF